MNTSNFIHAGFALAIQLVVYLLGFGLIAGAFAGAFYFIGREYAQAEYRYIQKFAGGKRSNMPYFGGFSPKAWELDALLDFIIPTITVTLIALLL